MKRINCRICAHYFVTWQAGKPHGCRAYGFRSGQIPSMVVFQSTGTECIQFIEKKPSKSS